MALYDFRRFQLIRAPLFLENVLGHTETRLLSRTEQILVDRLVERKYLQTVTDKNWSGYTLDPTIPYVSPASVITVDAKSDASKICNVIGEISKSLFLRHIVFINPNRHSMAKFAECAQLNGLSFEEASVSEIGLESQIFDRRGVLVGRRLPIRAQNMKQFICVEFRTSIVLRNYVESIGTFHLSSDGDVMPHYQERTYPLGNINTTNIEDIVLSANAEKHYRNTKDRRVKCCLCELRYACKYSFVGRSDMTNIYSSPSGCKYDPTASSNQNELFT